MAYLATRWLRDVLLTIGILAAILAAAAYVRYAMPRQPVDGEADEAAATAEADPGEPKFVRLERADVVASAGIEVEPVQTRPVENTITCNGSAAFNQNQYVKVPPRADGILGKIRVDVGAAVAAGDVLAVVDSPAVGDQKAAYFKAKVHEEHLRWQVDKLSKAIEGIPGMRLFEAQHLLEEQLADTMRIGDRLRTYGFTDEQIKAIPENKKLDNGLPVVTPRAGTVVARHAVEGEPVQTTMPLFAVVPLDTMWVNLSVYESHLPYIRLDQPVTFFPDGLPGVGFLGRVTWISPEVDPNTRTIQVRAEVANRDGALRANMFGKGQLAVEGSHQRLVVSQAAVQSHNGQHVVFVEKPEHVFEVRRISVGLKDDKFWEVTSGLAPGERVATTGSFLLKSNLENPEFGKSVE